MFINKYKRFLFFLSYLIFFFALAAVYHSDVLVNPFNYGRHWDWSFYSISDLYANYLSGAYMSFKQNSLGYFDVFSISLAEFLLKLAIFSIFKLAQLLQLYSVTIPIINKVTVFIVIPIFSSVGMWFLSRRLLKPVYQSHPFLFLIITTFCNIIYTFSLVLIFDLHGGALNRIIASAFYPWFFYVLFSYFEHTHERFFNFYIFLLAAIIAAYDISNIFYFSVMVIVAIILKKQPFKYKISHGFLFSLLLLCINIHWLHALVSGQASFTREIIASRRFDVSALAAYSSTYNDMLLFLNTPHDLILRTFGNNLLVYAPYIILHILLFYNLFHLKNRQGKTRILLLVLFGYFFTTVLTSGIYSIGKTYQWLYSFEFLAFIRGSIRYMPNLLMFTIFFFLVTLHYRYLLIKKHKTREYFYFITPIAIWLLFLLTNANLVASVMTNVVKNSPVNHDIGALYQYNPYPNTILRKERMVYNVLPVPSWFSPVFIDNVYPKTSQGSDTDNHFFNKGMIYTYGSVIPSAKLFEGFIKQAANPHFYSITNTKYIWFKNIGIFDELSSQSFTYNWVRESLNEYRQPLHLAYSTASLLKVPDQYIVPVIYTPESIVISDKTLRHIPEILQELKTPTSSLFMEKQNRGKIIPEQRFLTSDRPVIEFKKINTTKYRVVIHGARENFPLIFSTNYHDGWQAYITRTENPKPDVRNLEAYKILEGNEQDQASSKDLESYIEKRWISTLGNLQERKFKHIRISNGQEIPDHTEAYAIDFISKNLHGSIQNDNLSNGAVTETIFGKVRTIPENNHLKANGFANSWFLQTDLICKQNDLCKRNADGSYDFEIILQFQPQLYYYIAGLISILTLFVSLLFSFTKIIQHKNN